MKKKSNSRKKRKVNIKRLALLLSILIVIIVIIVGIFKLVVNLVSPEIAVGNYSNNNSGLAVSYGGVVYYNKYEEGIFKVKNKKETKLTDETAYSITVVKNTLYYLTISESNTIDLKSISIDGENSKKITTLSTPISKFYIENNNVFYVSNRQKMKIAKLSLENLEEQNVVESGIQDFVVSKGKVYYTNNEGHLYSVNTNGENAKEISKEYNFKNIQIRKNWIYFYDSVEKSLCKIKNNGKSKQTVSTFVNNEIYNVTNKKIYYFDNANKQICRCDLKGKKSVALVKIQSERTKINIANGVMYYLDKSQNDSQMYQMYRVKTNGGATNSIDY